MHTSETLPSFERPFPALTPAQRYSLDVFGYVVIPNVLSRDECGLVRDALQKLKSDLRQAGEGTKKDTGSAYFVFNKPHHVYMGSLLAVAPPITAYATHPRIVGFAEELIGGEARLVEFNAHINSRRPNVEIDPSPKFEFHRGTDVPYGSHIKNGLYHCKFVKTLTNLTDLGPDDGGTVVVAGSHKLDLPDEEIIECAYADRSLIHQVVAPAGSTLLFNETLIHATGQIRSDNERTIIIGGFGAAMLPWWDRDHLSESLSAKVPLHLRTLIFGKAHWTRGERYRSLKDPVDPRIFTLADGWWLDTENEAVG